MTLSERLRETAHELEKWSASRKRVVARLRALADECEGKVLVTVVSYELPSRSWCAYLKTKYGQAVGEAGPTKEEAIRKLKERFEHVD